MGFAVRLLHNVDLRQMREAIESFRKELRPGVVGLFYFAGHGLQVKGENYLVPIGARIAREQDVEFETVPVGRILGALEDAANEVNIVILDACRTNPFARHVRSFQRGLAATQAVTGSLIAYATAPGAVAADGAGRNGVYTTHLLHNMRLPGVPIEQVFKNVRIGVSRETHGQQIPWETSSLTGDFEFTRQEGPQVAMGDGAPPPATPQTSRQSSGSGSAPTTVTVELSSPTPGVTFQPRQRFPAIPGQKVKIAAAKQGYITAEKSLIVADHDMSEVLGPLQRHAELDQGEVERQQRQAEETERQSREAEQAKQAEQRQREQMLVAQGMKFIVKQEMLCITTQGSIVMGTTTLTGASSLSCEDAKRSLRAADEKRNACLPRWPDAKEGEKHWIGTASCPTP
jgi:hypothetical protein